MVISFIFTQREMGLCRMLLVIQVLLGATTPVRWTGTIWDSTTAWALATKWTTTTTDAPATTTYLQTFNNTSVNNDITTTTMSPGVTTTGYTTTTTTTTTPTRAPTAMTRTTTVFTSTLATAYLTTQKQTGVTTPNLPEESTVLSTASSGPGDTARPPRNRQITALEGRLSVAVAFAVVFGVLTACLLVTLLVLHRGSILSRLRKLTGRERARREQEHQSRPMSISSHVYTDLCRNDPSSHPETSITEAPVYANVPQQAKDTIYANMPTK